MQFFIERFHEIKKTMHDLESFYFDRDCLQDLKELEKAQLDNPFWSTGQEAIWNTSVSYRSLWVELRIQVTDVIYDNTTKMDIK